METSDKSLEQSVPLQHTLAQKLLMRYLDAKLTSVKNGSSSIYGGFNEFIHTLSEEDLSAFIDHIFYHIVSFISMFPTFNLSNNTSNLSDNTYDVWFIDGNTEECIFTYNDLSLLNFIFDSKKSSFKDLFSPKFKSIGFELLEVNKLNNPWTSPPALKLRVIL